MKQINKNKILKLFHLCNIYYYYYNVVVIIYHRNS
jgi:hypothetical protein